MVSWIEEPWVQAEVLRGLEAVAVQQRQVAWGPAIVHAYTELHTQSVTVPMSPRVTSLSVCIDAVASVLNGQRPQWNHEPLTCGFSGSSGTPSRALFSLPLSRPETRYSPCISAGQRSSTQSNYDAVLDLRYSVLQSSVEGR